MASFFRIVPEAPVTRQTERRREKRALILGYSKREAKILAVGEVGLKYTPFFWRRLREIRAEELEEYTKAIRRQTGKTISREAAAEGVAETKGHLTVFDIAEEMS